MKADPDLIHKLKFLIIARLFLASFVLGSILLFYLRKTWPYPITYMFIWAGSVYCSTFIYAIFLKVVKRLRAFAYIQIALDLVLITGLIYITGEKDSIFAFLYELSIMSACIILYKRGCVLVASLSCIFYGSLLDLEYYGIIPTLSPQEYGPGIVYHLLINFSAFYLIAILATVLTEQIRISKAKLHQLEALHKHIIRSLNAGLLTIDRGKTITSFNRTAELITGLRAKDTLGKKLETVFPQLDIDEKISGEIGFLKPDKGLIPLGYSASSLKDEKGSDLGKVIIFRDLTEIKRMRALSIIGRFAASIAHEIRNPLTAISGCIQLLNQELKLNSENKKIFNIILNEIRRLNLLTLEFLNFARSSEDKKKKTNIKEVIDETLKLIVKSETFRRDISIEKRLLNGIYVESNPERLRQIFWNLFLNAVEAMPDGGRLGISMDLPLRGFVSINIKDTGTGIKEEYIHRIFEPFFSTKENGTGLGLSIVQKVIEELEGRIELKTKIGEGTDFKITLPVAG